MEGRIRLAGFCLPHGCRGYGWFSRRGSGNPIQFPESALNTSKYLFVREYTTKGQNVRINYRPDR
jgi:hypothetical protein